MAIRRDFHAILTVHAFCCCRFGPAGLAGIKGIGRQQGRTGSIL